MRYSKLFGRSTRAVSHDVRSKGHEFLLRGGFLRESSSGRFYLLPLGLRVQEKICGIVREELDAIGAQQLLAPILHPLELWEETQRNESVSFELMKVRDRNDRSFVLGGTAEEMMVAVVRQFALSERDLPLCIYQFSTKFRDELRARGGLLRAREFLMKDAYSFHASREDFEGFYAQMGEIYLRIFNRLGIPAHLVASDNGYMGGDYAHELIVEHAVGESRYLVTEDGSYAAHEDIASFQREEMNSTETELAMQIIEVTRGPSIDDGVQYHQQPAWRQIKTLVYITDTNEPVIVSIRGDLEISEAKLLKALGCFTLRLATSDEVQAIGSVIGFVSPLNKNVRTIGDLSLTSVRNFITGADRDGHDTINVNYGRDFTVDLLCDIAIAQDGHRAAHGAYLRDRRGIEVGNIFQLGTWYSDRMKGATFMSSGGSQQPFYMGCYGLGVSRVIATIAELHHDADGLRWPSAVAPFQVHLLQLGAEESVRRHAEQLYEALMSAGHEVLFDDRDASAGIKFADADLLGIPNRVIASSRLTLRNAYELQVYRRDSTEEVDVEQLLRRLPRGGD